MIDRTTVITAVRDELDADAQQCREKHAAIGARVADRLGLLEGAVAPAGGHDASGAARGDASLVDEADASVGAGGHVAEDLHDASGLEERRERGKVWLFARRVGWVPVATAARFGGVILATRSGHAAQPNRSPGWVEAVLARGVELAGWDWMLAPGAWKPGLASHISWLAAVGARALLLNVEPRPPASGEDWRGQHEELRRYTETARELCELRGLELWVTSWSLPSSAPSFPWLELLRPAHRALPQPYEVHGMEGDAYVAQVLREWRERGAREIILGRGAHELDKSDDDAWRTPAEITEHRASTPAGMDEAWWVPGGLDSRRGRAVVDAILAP